MESQTASTTSQQTKSQTSGYWLTKEEIEDLRKEFLEADRQSRAFWKAHWAKVKAQQNPEK